MESATEGKSKTESLITRFARYYTPCVVVAAVVLALVPPCFDGGQFAKWITRALNFLVVSCPCALVISVPLSFFGGMGAVSRAGMIAKGGIALENLARADTAVFDKTGTLTTGELSVTQVLSQGMEQEKLLGLAAERRVPPTIPSLGPLSGQPGRFRNRWRIFGKFPDVVSTRWWMDTKFTPEISY